MSSTKTISRADVVEAVAAETGLSNAKVNEVLGAVLTQIQTQLRKGNKVTFVGHGTYETRRRKARTGRNPATGDTIKITASTVPAFKAGATLKVAVNK